MELHVLLIILLAAAAHASWNAWLKDRSADLIGFATIAVGWLVAGVTSAVFLGLPDPDSLPYLAVTTLVHTVYALFLVQAYQNSEYSLAYPIARGSAPLFVIVAAPLLLNEHLQGPSQFAVIFLVVGIFLIGLCRNNASLGGTRAVLLSLATGALIATYTLIDAEGARADTSSLTYSAWLFIFTAAALIGLAFRQHGSGFFATIKSRAKTGIPMGILSAMAYAAILWAMTIAPTALVAAIRETSILFAALIGWCFFREKIRPLRWLGIFCMLGGLLLAKL